MVFLLWASAVLVGELHARDAGPAVSTLVGAQLPLRAICTRRPLLAPPATHPHPHSHPAPASQAAQAAALIGDFSNWEPVWMTKDQWGVWSVTLPDGGGNTGRGAGGRGGCSRPGDRHSEPRRGDRAAPCVHAASA